jgi:hydrogenase maturation protease
VIDAARLDGPPGTVRCFEDAQMDRYLGRAQMSVHEVGLSDLMDMARLSDTLPHWRALIGIQPADLDLGSQPTAVVEAAVPEAARLALGLARQWRAEAALYK